MKLRDLLELCRVSNLPTVWSNVWLGMLAGIAVDRLNSSDPLPYKYSDAIELAVDLSRAILPMLAISLLYCGGMVLNDYLDRETDALERPNRPIPSGRIAAHQAVIIARVMLFVGWAGMALAGLIISDDWPWPTIGITAFLIALIVLYNYCHSKSSLSVVVMAACRAMIVFAGASMAMGPSGVMEHWLLFICGPALTLFFYTLVISIIARYEMQPRWFGGPKTIMNMIAAMPLLDAVWLFVMGLWPASLFCVACAGLTKLGHRKVAGS